MPVPYGPVLGCVCENKAVLFVCFECSEGVFICFRIESGIFLFLFLFNPLWVYSLSPCRRGGAGEE